jgi:hypothetical protein
MPAARIHTRSYGRRRDGRSRFSFDLWGDTVNVAAPLPGFGSEAAIHLSGDGWARIEESSCYASRGFSCYRLTPGCINRTMSPAGGYGLRRLGDLRAIACG